MQRCAGCPRNPCSFRKLTEHAGHQVEHNEPPGALVAVMQPLGGDGKPPEQPRNEDNDHHDDEERRGNAGGGKQDNRGHYPGYSKE